MDILTYSLVLDDPQRTILLTPVTTVQLGTCIQVLFKKSTYADTRLSITIDENCPYISISGQLVHILSPELSGVQFHRYITFVIRDAQTLIELPGALDQKSDKRSFIRDGHRYFAVDDTKEDFYVNIKSPGYQSICHHVHLTGQPYQTEMVDLEPEVRGISITFQGGGSECTGIFRIDKDSVIATEMRERGSFMGLPLSTLGIDRYQVRVEGPRSVTSTVTHVKPVEIVRVEENTPHTTSPAPVVPSADVLHPAPVLENDSNYETRDRWMRYACIAIISILFVIAACYFLGFFSQTESSAENAMRHMPKNERSEREHAQRESEQQDETSTAEVVDQEEPAPLSGPVEPAAVQAEESNTASAGLETASDDRTYMKKNDVWSRSQLQSSSARALIDAIVTGDINAMLSNDYSKYSVQDKDQVNGYWRACVDALGKLKNAPADLQRDLRSRLKVIANPEALKLNEIRAEIVGFANKIK